MGASTSWSRRGVLVAAGAAAGTVALSGPLASVAAAATGGAGRVGLARAHWTALLGRTVTVDGPAGRSRARVARVEDLKGAPAGDARRFAVELRTDRGPADLGGLRPITLPGRGVATLFVSEIPRSTAPRSFEIVVNNVS